MRSSLTILTASLVSAALGCAATFEEGRPCSEGCEAGRTCVVGRCRPEGELPAPEDALRVVLSPVDMAVIASGDAAGASRGGASAPETVTLGREGGGTVEMLLRFESTLREGAEVTSAFVVLDPVAAAPPASSPTSVEVARILEPWSPATVTWGRQPRLALPRAAGVLRARPGAPSRVDVTALVRDWGRRLPDDHGIAIIFRGSDAAGSTFSMGTTSGGGPRLDAYVR